MKNDTQNECEMLERFGRQLLVRGWTVRAQQQLASLPIGVAPVLEEAREYLRGAGAERLFALDERPPPEPFAALILDGGSTDSHRLTESVELLITIGPRAVSVRTADGQTREYLTPDGPTALEVSQATACALLLRELMVRNVAPVKN